MQYGDYRGFYSFFMRHLESLQDLRKEVTVVPILSEYMWRESQGVLDSYINFCAFIIEVRNELMKG
jgi:hypothetical protein